MKRRLRNPLRCRWVVRARYPDTGREVTAYGWPRGFRTHYFASREHRGMSRKGTAINGLVIYSLERLP